MAKTSMKVKQQRTSEVLYQRVHSLQDLWSSTFSFEKIRNLQNMFP